MRQKSKQMAFGGVMAALAITIMCLGGIIPVATYVCPALCALLLKLVLLSSGERIAWAWYAAVSVLCLLLGPDKEAAAVFLFLGYYPIVKPKLDRSRLPWLWKLCLFNAASLVMYALLIHLFGMEALADEFRKAGVVLAVFTLLLGNVTFIMLDRLLGMKIRRRGK